MQLKRSNSLVVGTLLLGALFVFSSGAQAVPCGYGGVTPSGICADGTTNTDSEAAMNALAFGGFTDWAMLTKSDAGIDSAFWTGDFTGPTGTFTLNSNIWADYGNLAVVLKDGGSTTNADIKWSAYMLVNQELNYAWDYDGRKNISHVSLYARGAGTPPNDTPVPEPATMLLFGTGLLGFAGSFRKYLR